MKQQIIALKGLIFIVALSSCSTIKKAPDADSGINVEAEPTDSVLLARTKPVAPIDMVMMEYKPNISGNVKYQVFRARKDGKSGWMNILGDWIVTPEYDTAFSRDWSEGVNICRKGGLYGAVNYKNEIVVPFKYTRPPSDCEYGLILVKDDHSKEAYYSKKGKQLTKFKTEQPTFRNGFAIVVTKYQHFSRYYHSDEEDIFNSSELFTCDFMVLNSHFDTLLKFKNAPFLLEFGTLNNNRRTFFLYPYLANNGDRGINFGQYGYLNAEGEIAIPPKFRASDVFIRTSDYVHEPDCPFRSYLSKVRNLNEYYYIDTLGNKVFGLDTSNARPFGVSEYNDSGFASYQTYVKEAHSYKIHIMDRTGKIVFEALENEASISYVEGNSCSAPRNDVIPIWDYKKNVLSVYTPAFTPFATLPLADSLRTVRYFYRGLIGSTTDDHFIVTQFRRSKRGEGYPGSQQRLVDRNGIALSSWFSYKTILSRTFGNFAVLDSATMTNTLYDFNKKALFQCDSCFLYPSTDDELLGVYHVSRAKRKPEYVNYEGKILSELFDSMEEKSYDLAEQVKVYNSNDSARLGVNKEEIIRLFNESVMYRRIWVKNSQSVYFNR